jgi:hypothetical protein
VQVPEQDVPRVDSQIVDHLFHGGTPETGRGAPVAAAAAPTSGRALRRRCAAARTPAGWTLQWIMR